MEYTGKTFNLKFRWYINWHRLFPPYGFPTMDQHLEMVSENCFTPDLSELEQYVTHPVFVPDDLMTGHRRHHLLGGAERKAWAFTKQSFSVWKHKKKKYTHPILLEERSSIIPNSVVKGELYFLPTDTIKAIDNHRTNGIQFIRKRLPVVVPYHKKVKQVKVVRVKGVEELRMSEHISRQEHQKISAFVWVGNPPFWEDNWNTWAFSKVEQDSWVAGVEPGLAAENEKYYFFKYKEYFER